MTFQTSGRSERARRRALCLVLAALLGSGCGSSWQVRGGSPATVVESAKKSSKVRLTLDNGRELEGYEATVREDSLTAWIIGASGSGKSRRIGGRFCRRMSIPLNEIRSMETREAGPTLGAAVLNSYNFV